MADRMMTSSITLRDLERSSRDPNIINARYFKNGSRLRLSYNGAPIGNGMRGIKWSLDR